MDIRTKKPLSGFGPLGWIALAILASFIIALLRGWSPVHTAAWLIWTQSNESIGIWVRHYFNWWVGPGLAWRDVGFGPMGLLYLPIILFIHPRRASRSGILLVVAGVLIECYCTPWLRPLSAYFGTTTTTIALSAKAAAAVIQSFGLCMIFRRAWVPVVFLPALTATVFLQAYSTTGVLLQPWVARVWDILFYLNHISIAGTLLALAIAERRKPVPNNCPTCGYDLAGLPPATPCPECGNEKRAALAARA